MPKKLIAQKINTLVDLQNQLKEFMNKNSNTFKKITGIKKLYQNELVNFPSGELINPKSTKRDRDDRINNRETENFAKISKFKGFYQNIHYKIGFQDDDENLVDETQMERELIKCKSILNNIAVDKFNKRDKTKNLMIAFNVQYIMSIEADKDDNKELFEIKRKINYKFKEFHFSSITNVIKSEASLIEMINEYIAKLIKNIEEQKINSKFKFYTIRSLNIQYIYKNKTKAGSYLETPLFLQNRRSIMNVKNENDRCIDYALTGFLMLEINEDIKLRDRVSFYENSNEFKMLKIPDGITYPIDINKDIPKYERLNNMKINVFIPFENKIVPLYNTNKYYDRICNVILFEENDKKHICLITNINNLLGSTNGRHKCFHCTHCLDAHYDTKEKLDTHFKNCINNDACNAVYPEKDKNDKLKYTSFDKEFKHPFYCTLDFEATLEKVDIHKKKTNLYQKHKANSYGLKYNCIHEEYSKKVKIFGSADENEIMKNLMKDIEGYARESYNLIKQNEKTYEDNEDVIKLHKSKKYCDCCNIKFDKENYKVFHHDHITSKYISSLCNKCNLKLQYKKMLPIYVHNLKNYDSHFIVRALNKYSENEKDTISCIPNNEEKYISFSKNIVVDSYINKDGKEQNIYFEIRFLDTFSFMSTSLSDLVDNLRGKNKSIDELRTIF